VYLEDLMAGDNFSDLSRMIEAVSKEKSIDKQLVIDAVIQGMIVAARKKYGTYREIEAQYNEDTGEVELFEFKEVVLPEDFIDEEIEIKLDEARELQPDVQLNDSVGIKLDATELGRIAAQTAKQIITQKVRDAEREIIYNEFESRKGEVASGIARRVERGMIVVDLGKTEAFIPLREQIPGEVYKPGDRVQGYLLDVRQTTRGPQIIMSRACEQYLVKLFEQEVPEIYDGIVQIVAAAREPGARAKIAVVSRDPSVDPVGACVGMKGSRVQQVVQELRGEKIDIINWDEDITRFACNALAPAEISRVFVDEANKEMEVVVPDTQLSLAIGRKGQNVRLASKITTWKLDILSESSASQKTADAIFNLLLIPGMSETMAQNVFQSGFGSFQSLASANVADVMAIPGYGTEEQAAKLIADSKALIEKYKKEGVAVPAAPVKVAMVTPVGNVKAQADERLRAELAALNKQETNATEPTPDNTIVTTAGATDAASVSGSTTAE
jgi:N utilization substance protein A